MEPKNIRDRSQNLNSFKKVIKGITEGTTIGVIKGDTRSSDYSSCNPLTFNNHPKYISHP